MTLIALARRLHRDRAAFLPRLRLALEVRRQRDRLALLDADRLSDLGLTADEVRAEAARPLWDVPASWRL